MELTVGAWLRQAKRQIATLDAELIAVRNFAPQGRDRSWLVAHAEENIVKRDLMKANRMVEKRRRGVPLAYILGEKEFYGRQFKVNRHVLIPRPETEMLVDLIKGLNLPKRSRFLEIGTGSGCLAITLALEFPQAYVMATDVSVMALDTAYQNDVLHEGRVEFRQSNLLRDLEFTDLEQGEPEHFEVIVANLPYVNENWDWVDKEQLEFEPRMALYARGNNGLSIYQRFLKEVRYHENRCGLLCDYLVLEADPCQQPALVKMAEKAGFFHVRTEGYGLVFEDGWRYFWDFRTQKYIHKPEKVIQRELRDGYFSFAADEEAGD